MASGPNQHHIPQFLQRAFAPKSKGRPKDIWNYVANAEPELTPISKTAAEDYFYGSTSLDERFKPAENRLAPECAALRKQTPGYLVNPALAAEIVTHLAPRSSHLRASMASAMQQLSAVARSIFSDPQQVKQLLGLEQDRPNDVFLEKIRGGVLDRPEIAQAGLPQPVLERAAFFIAKESFAATSSEHLPIVTRSLIDMAAEAKPLAQDGHIRALEGLADGPNVRQDRLSEYQWSIEAAPPCGAILPDCIALAYGPENPALPLMFVGRDLHAVVMPLGSDRLLVGRKSDSVVVDTSEFNEDAAACSQEFFLASDDSESLRDLASLIGTRTETFFGWALDEGAKRAFPHAYESDQPDAGTPRSTELTPSEDQLQFSYQLSFAGFASEDVAHEIVDVVKGVVSSMARHLPLSRLDGFTFAADYPVALREVDRGRPDLPPIETVTSDSVIGIAKMVVVMRDDEPKGRIVLDASIAENLISDEEGAREWALHVLIHQLTLVSMIGLVERALPGTFLQPIDGEFQSFLYREIDAALNGYVAASMSATFGDPEEFDGMYRTFLIDALGAMKRDIEAARFAYRYDGDVDKLLAVAMPAVGQVLYFAAELLGNCVGADRPVLDEEGKLRAALQHANLIHWLDDFGRDLERFHQRLGVWRSFDEFLALNRHVERLLWSVGMFPWENPEGLRVEVPLLSDAQALYARWIEDQTDKDSAELRSE